MLSRTNNDRTFKLGGEVDCVMRYWLFFKVKGCGGYQIWDLLIQYWLPVVHIIFILISFVNIRHSCFVCIIFVTVILQCVEYAIHPCFLSFLKIVFCWWEILFSFQTNKKKLFVLREESSSGPARLEYFDSEKKFKTGISPKRCIVLKNCFSINAKSDARHRHAVILYTKDDCFGVAFDNDAECQEWLTLMLDLRSQSIEDSTLTRPLFGKLFG